MADEKRSRADEPVTELSEAPRGDGVDVSLIRCMLSLTPRERLEPSQQAVSGILEPRHAKERN